MCKTFSNTCVSPTIQFYATALDNCVPPFQVLYISPRLSFYIRYKLLFIVILCSLFQVLVCSSLNRHYICRATNSPKCNSLNKKTIIWGNSFSSKIKCMLSYHLNRVQAVDKKTYWSVYLLVAKIDSRYYTLNTSDENLKVWIHWILPGWEEN